MRAQSVLDDAGMEQFLGPLLQSGSLGVVLGWLMWRVEGKMDKQNAATEQLRQAINRLAMAHLLEVASRPEVPQAVKYQAQVMINEIKAETPTPPPQGLTA